MQDVLVLATVLAPIITGLVQLLKISFPILKKWIPLSAVLIGILIGFLATPFSDLDPASRLWAGGLAGLSSTGLFELAFNSHSSTDQRHNKK
ncbi:MAG: holin [Sporolactobacillus sp.]